MDVIRKTAKAAVVELTMMECAHTVAAGHSRGYVTVNAHHHWWSSPLDIHHRCPGSPLLPGSPWRLIPLGHGRLSGQRCSELLDSTAAGRRVRGDGRRRRERGKGKKEEKKEEKKD